jgi:heterodisulfide reductase subunit A
MTLAGLLDDGFDAVFLAAGAHKGMELKLGGEGEQPPVLEALRFLEEVNLGSRVTIEKRVVVVGGGNAAVDAARAALRLGAEKVTIAYRRRREEMPALAEEVQAATEEGVDLHTQVQPTALTAAGLLCVRTEPGEPDASGRSRPVPVEGSDETFPADLVISAVGQGPDPAMFKSGDLELELNRDTTIRVDDLTGQTSHERIFAGGDLAAGDRFVTSAMAWGRRAAWGIDQMLRGQDEADKRPPPPRPDPTELPPSRAGIKRADQVPRQTPAELPAKMRGSSFAEVVQTLTEEQARLEASRCLVCGMCGNCRTCLDLFGCPAFYVREEEVRIDPNLCMGCGVCVHVCPNIAIREVAAPQPDVADKPEFGPLEDRAEEQDE